MSRIGDLLTAAADDLAAGKDPFGTAFLSEHEVTMDEAHTMAEQIAGAVRMFLGAQKHIGVLAVLIAAEHGGPGLADAAMNVAIMEGNKMRSTDSDG